MRFPPTPSSICINITHYTHSHINRTSAPLIVHGRQCSKPPPRPLCVTWQAWLLKCHRDHSGGRTQTRRDGKRFREMRWGEQEKEKIPKGAVKGHVEWKRDGKKTREGGLRGQTVGLRSEGRRHEGGRRFPGWEEQRGGWGFGRWERLIYKDTRRNGKGWKPGGKGNAR